MPRELIRVRTDLKISRTHFAIYLRTNVRTPGKTGNRGARIRMLKPAVINLVKRYADTVLRLATI